MLKHLENSISSDPKLKKAPVNYEGVCLTLLVARFEIVSINYDEFLLRVGT